MRIERKLTDDQVREIRALAAKGQSDDELANRYGVHKGHVRALRTGRSRKRAGGPVTRRQATRDLERRVARLERELDDLRKTFHACGGVA